MSHLCLHTPIPGEICTAGGTISASQLLVLLLPLSITQKTQQFNTVFKRHIDYNARSSFSRWVRLRVEFLWQTLTTN